MHEFVVEAKTSFSNPFTSTTMVGQFTSPSGKIKIIDGFYDGKNVWRLRFVPDEEGEWHYRLVGEGVDILQDGHLNCISSPSHGFIQIHPDNPYCFAYSDGTPFFPMGETCYGLHDDSPISPRLRTKYLQMRRDQCFNYVRMSVGHSYQHALINPIYWAWGGTPENPDFESLNPSFFRSLDDLFMQMREIGMNVELILLNFYRLPFTNTKQWTPSRERLWINYLLCRYSAFDNIFMWTISNEYETHPDGIYRLDLPDDPDWVKSTARYIKMNDPYRHLVTVHPVISASTTGVTPRDAFGIPWRIGEFFGNCGDIDILSQQTGQAGEGIKWNKKLRCWAGDDPNLVASIHADRVFRKPVINSESGYEYLRGTPSYRNQVHCTDKVRRSKWLIVCAGGYFAAGFAGTLGMSDIWNTIDAPNHYTFILKDEGAPRQLANIYKLFQTVPYWKMNPFFRFEGDAVALAEEGKHYIIYLPHGGDITIDLSNNGLMETKWYNPRSGKFLSTVIAKTGHDSKFKAPDKKDWVLIINSFREE
ncbi:MAG: DUF4038 domain-containing protein [Bacteroidales bacterium]|nr:DUF4038 domain-containing protein [Bacteroidales bacterium]